MTTRTFATFKLSADKSTLENVIQIGTEMRSVHTATYDSEKMHAILDNSRLTHKVVFMVSKSQWKNLSKEESAALIGAMEYSISGAMSLHMDNPALGTTEEELQDLRERYFKAEKIEKPADYDRLRLSLDEVSLAILGMLSEDNRHCVFFMNNADGSSTIKVCGASQKALSYLEGVAVRELDEFASEKEMISNGQFEDAGLKFELGPAPGKAQRKHLNYILTKLISLAEDSAV